MTEKLNVAIIGFGTSARVFHLPFLLSSNKFDIKKVYERNSEEAKKYIKGVVVVHNLSEILEDQSIDLVIITTPNTTHYDLAKKSILAHKHTIVEKPFTINSSQGEELIKLAKEKNVLLSVFQNRRFDGDFLTVKKVVQSGYLGEIVEYEAHFDRFRNFIKGSNWKESPLEGSGILYDLGAHLIDQAIDLFGLPEKIFADIRIQRPNSLVHDYFEVNLYYKNLKATLKAGMLVREPLPHFIISGTEGSFVKFGMDVQEGKLKAGLMPIDIEFGKEPIEQWGTLNTNIEGIHFQGKLETEIGNYQLYYEDIYSGIKENKPRIIKAEDSLEVIKIIELAYKSYGEGKVIKYN
ncbi:MAG TPA: Gfo/Idh/MocA family oxidoreductase [Clostridiaceae bacterium]